MSLKLTASGGCSVTLQGTTTARNLTLNLLAATSTVVGTNVPIPADEPINE